MAYRAVRAKACADGLTICPFLARLLNKGLGKYSPLFNQHYEGSIKERNKKDKRFGESMVGETEGKMRIKKVPAYLLVVALVVFSVSVGLPFKGFETPVKAAKNEAKAPKRKISSDLESIINKNPAGQLAVIIQTPAAPSDALRSTISRGQGNVRRNFANVNAMAVQLPPGQVRQLATRSDVGYISLDRKTNVSGHVEVTTGADQARSQYTQSGQPIDGAGIGIAVIDSGVDISHHSFLSSRVVASVDFTGEGRTDDPFGHGTHVAGIAAGNGHIAQGAYTGIAPAASVINVRVLDSQGQGSVSNAVAGIDWCISNKTAYNIRVLNLSLGSTAVDSYVDDPLCQAARRAFQAGIVVCAAAGNLGKDSEGNKLYGAIHTPGIEPSAITVGAANTFGTDSRSDDGVTSYSSRGPTRGYYTDTDGVKHFDNLIKPDLIAPGNRIIAAKSPGNYLVTAHPELDTTVSSYPAHSMMNLSGTSMATPVVAGTVALVLQRNPQLTPNLVKALLEYTSQPLAGFNNLEQGAGLLNIEGAVRMAGIIRQDIAVLQLGDSLLVPNHQTMETSFIAGQSFAWGGGIIQRWNFITGPNLMQQYQLIYGTGVILTDGVIVTDGHLLADGHLLSDGAMLSDGVMESNGTTLANGVIITDGHLLADGILLSDGHLLADGHLLSDSTVPLSTSSTMGLSALLNGDTTSQMPSIIDTGGGD